MQNLFNQHYYAAGTFFDRSAIPFLALSDPRTFIPGMPLAAYGGIRASGGDVGCPPPESCSLPSICCRSSGDWTLVPGT